MASRVRRSRCEALGRRNHSGWTCPAHRERRRRPMERTRRPRRRLAGRSARSGGQHTPASRRSQRLTRPFRAPTRTPRCHDGRVRATRRLGVMRPSDAGPSSRTTSGRVEERGTRRRTTWPRGRIGRAVAFGRAAVFSGSSPLESAWRLREEPSPNQRGLHPGRPSRRAREPDPLPGIGLSEGPRHHDRINSVGPRVSVHIAESRRAVLGGYTGPSDSSVPGWLGAVFGPRLGWRPSDLELDRFSTTRSSTAVQEP